MIRIFLDDIRNPTDKLDWVICRNVEQAKSLLEGADISGEKIIISFDHDLGDCEPTGYDLAKYIEECCHTGRVFNIFHYFIHSSNPVGRNNIQMAMDSCIPFITEKYRKGVMEQ